MTNKPLRVAILGTRGIPNQYGGFEQFAEYLSVGLVKKGYEVTVYNPHFHDYAEPTFQGVTIIKKYSPEKQLGAAANFLYDYLCLKDALKRDFDIIYEAGYQSAALSYLLLPIKKSIIITNMDGLEWKRSKWSAPVKKVTLFFEKVAVKKSHYLISDNEGIRKYFLEKYNADSFLVEYGANPVENIYPEATLKEYQLSHQKYFLLIARLEPENNIEMAVDGYLKSESKLPFIIIGNYNSKYGLYLRDKYVQTGRNIIFLGAVYNKAKLDDLRNSCLCYFHGHSVGGTNPSLLEAMASKAFIAAHDNAFNKDVLEENAKYFQNTAEVTDFINNIDKYQEKRNVYIENNLNKISRYYTWENIINKHAELFEKLTSKK